MAYQGSAVPACSHFPAARRGQGLLQSLKFDRAASDFLSEQTRWSILYWNRGAKRGSPGAIENRIAGNGTLLCYKSPSSQVNFTLLISVDAPSLSNKTRLILISKSEWIYVPADKAHCSGCVFEALITKVAFGAFVGT